MLRQCDGSGQAIDGAYWYDRGVRYGKCWACGGAVRCNTQRIMSSHKPLQIYDDEANW